MGVPILKLVHLTMKRAKQFVEINMLAFTFNDITFFAIVK